MVYFARFELVSVCAENRRRGGLRRMECGKRFSVRNAAAFAVAAVLAVAFLPLRTNGSDVWTQGNLSGWSREKNAISVSNLPSGVVEARHTGKEDWSLHGMPRVAATKGDVFRLSCRMSPLDGTKNMANLSVVLYGGEKGEAVNWAYAPARRLADGSLVSEFMVPAGCTALMPRVTGWGPCAVAVDGLKLERTGRIDLPEPDAAEKKISSGTLEARIVQSGGIEVKDKRTGRVWSPATKFAGYCVAKSMSADADGKSLSAEYVLCSTVRTFKMSVRIDKENELLVSVDGDLGELKENFALRVPLPFETRKGDRLIVPMNEGISYPADETDNPPARLIAYGGHGICMAFWGVQDDSDGSGMMGIFETPDDGSLLIERAGKDRLLTPGAGWNDQKRKFGYERRLRFVFFDKGGYVAMCKRYRAYAKEKGLLKTFAEKVKERPLIDRLFGAPNIWCWERDKLKVARNLKDAGIDRFLWSGGGTTGEVAALAAMPGVLVGKYDVYQDIYHPDQLKKLGWKKGWHTSAWPDDVIWNSENSNDWRRAWGVKTKSGEWTHCAMMCDARAVGHCRRSVSKELKTFRYNTRFVDTTVASPWQVCWNPAHPMTRSDSKFWKMELLRVLGDEFGLVVGSETGHDASVPYCDYFEGMLSLGPYRVPDSGRNLKEIWTNAPPRVVKYQVGEKYRLPLWELVYHDCVCAQWYWGDYNNKLPGLWDKRDLFNVLYGTMGMYLFNAKQWDALKDRFVQSYRLTSPVARATGYSEMTNHEILSADRSVQRSEFADGTSVTVNFGSKPFRLKDGSVIGPVSAKTSLGSRRN